MPLVSGKPRGRLQVCGRQQLQPSGISGTEPELRGPGPETDRVFPSVLWCRQQVGGDGSSGTNQK